MEINRGAHGSLDRVQGCLPEDKVPHKLRKEG